MRYGPIAVLVLLVACGNSNDSSSAGGSSSSSSGGSSSGSTSSSGSPSSSGVPGPGTTSGACTIFPADNPWNTDISAAPLDTALMTNVMPGMALGTALHPDWGTFTEQYGIPITVGKASAPVPLTFNTNYGPGESDKLPCPSGGGEYCYPIPLDAKIEGGTGAKSGSDRHVLFLATDNAPDHCVLYELYNTQNPSSGGSGGFTVASAAIWHLDTNALRPEGWTSADAAGLPILPGLVRYEEIQKGVITHAIRFTMDSTRNGYIHPATHAAGSADASLPPMGLRMRLKATFDDSKLPAAAKVVTTAMKKYGLLLADNGSNWYLSGETNDGWSTVMDDVVTGLGKVKGSDFEIVKTGDIVIQPQ